MIIDDYMLEAYGDNLEALEEAYSGKTKQLLDLEKMIGENRKKYYSTVRVGGSYYSDPDFEKIGDKIAKIFGFKYCDFNLVNDPAPNAFTVPCGFSFTNYTNNVNIKKINRYTYRFHYSTKDMSTVIRVTSGLWSNKEFTDGEVAAIIIHEVGHNFQHNTNRFLRGYSIYMVFMNMFNSISNFIAGNIPGAAYGFIMNDSELRADINKWAKQSSMKDLIVVFGNVTGFVKFITYEVMELVGRITLGIPAGFINVASILMQGATNPISALFGILISPIKKGAENVADDFAASHGYGPELISVLSKIDLDPEASATAVGRVAKKLPLFDSICTLFAIPSMVVSSVFTDHPVTPKRAAGMVAELKRELNKSDVSPKVKKEIEKQIKEVEDALNSMSKAESPLEGTALRKAIYRFQTNFNKDPRHFIQKTASKKNLIETMNLLDEDYRFIVANEGDCLDDAYTDDEAEKDIMDEVMDSDYEDMFC